VEEKPAGREAEQHAAEEHGEDPEVAEGTSTAREGGSGWLNTEVAAAALGVSPRTVRDYIAAGKLAARTEGSGVQRRHMVDIGSLQALLDDRRRESAASPRSRREDRASVDAAVVAAGSAEPSAAETIRDLVTRLEARSAEAADARARLELTERAESTLRGELEREREERRRAQEEAHRMREELEAERSKGFWRRLFGG
jgi:helix-turn-helix protein